MTPDLAAFRALLDAYADNLVARSVGEPHPDDPVVLGDLRARVEDAFREVERERDAPCPYCVRYEKELAAMRRDLDAARAALREWVEATDALRRGGSAFKIVDRYEKAEAAARAALARAADPGNKSNEEGA